MYQNLAQQYIMQGKALPAQIHELEEEMQRHFDEFYEDVYTELSAFGEIDELHVCNNLGDHLVGNVYAKFISEDSAAAAQKVLHDRFYAGRMLICEFSPVTDFREARCRQFDMSECNRGGYCNFMHLYRPSHELEKRLQTEFKRTRKRSPRRDRSRERERDGGDRDINNNNNNRERERERDRDRDRERRDDRDRRHRRSRERHRERSRSRSRSRSPRERSRERDRKREKPEKSERSERRTSSRERK